MQVQRGDSVWAIAERFADGRDVGSVARQVVAANLGTVMPDGHRFSTPALIEPGWLLNVPTSASAVIAPTVAPSSVEGYVVAPGDSYWGIAEHHMESTATGSEIAAYAQRLMAINAPVLGYSDPRLVRPGDVVLLGEQSMPEVEPQPAPVPVPAIVPVSVPVLEEPAPLPLPDPLPLLAPTVVEAPSLAPATSTASFPPPVVPSATAGPGSAAVPSPPVIGHSADDNIALGSGLGAALVLAGGAVAALASRRRQQLRGAGVGARLTLPTPQAIETEMVLRALNADEQLARIDPALRSVARELAGQQARPLALEIDDDGEIRLYTDQPAMTVAPRWLLDIDCGAWRLPAAVSLAELADDARRSNQPCPAIIHLGASAGGQLFVDLEAIGSLVVDAAPDVAASIFAAQLKESDPRAIRATEYRTNVGLSGDDYVELDLDLSGSMSAVNSFQINPLGGNNIQIAGGRAAKREWLGRLSPKHGSPKRVGV